MPEERFGLERKILVDGDERTFTYREIIRASLALGHALTKGTRVGDSVGVMLPTGRGIRDRVLALCAYGRVPTMLNFTAGLQNVRAAIRMARATRVVTAHRFIALGQIRSAGTGAWRGKRN